MTTQNAISGQSVGTSTNVGNSLFSINPLTLSNTTTAFIVSVKLTNGATGDVDKNQVIRVWYTTTTYTVTAANAPHDLRATARYVDIRPAAKTSGVQIVDSALEPKTGAKFHCWCDVPKYPSAGSLDVTLVECPS